MQSDDPVQKLHTSSIAIIANAISEIMVFYLDPDDPEFDEGFIDEGEKETYYASLLEDGYQCTYETYDTGELRLEMTISLDYYSYGVCTRTITITEEEELP